MTRRLNIVFIPHRGERRHRDGAQWKLGMTWGADFMLQQATRLTTQKFKIIPRYNFEFQDFSGIDLIHLHNIATTALKRDLLFRRDSDIRLYVKNKGNVKIIGGVRGEVGLERARKFLRYFDGVHVSNNRLYEKVKELTPKVYLLYPGVDTCIFKFLGEPENFIIGWAGDKNKKMKNFHLMERLGYPLLTATKENYVPHEKMPEFYNSCSVYVYVSSHEGCNRTIIEAAACARPIVSSDAGAVREFLDDEWIVETPPSDEEKFLAETRQRIETLRLSQELRREVGTRNMLRAKRWDWEEIIRDMEKMWIDVLEK